MASTDSAVILLMAHFVDDDLLAGYRKIKADLAGRHDVVLLLNVTKLHDTPEIPPDVACHTFSAADVRALRYPGKSDLTSPNVELFVVAYWKAQPDYDYYWGIEYDVKFSGSWDRVFAHFQDNDADLLGTSIHTRDFNPHWGNWGSLKSPAVLGDDQMVRGFFPIFRISQRGLIALDAAYRQGWNGHFECSMPSAVAAAGLRLEDIGGDGPFVAPGNTNRFYTNTLLDPNLTPGSFVFRPTRTGVGAEPDLLWHPVKPPHIRQWETGRIKRWAQHAGDAARSLVRLAAGRRA